MSTLAATARLAVLIPVAAALLGLLAVRGHRQRAAGIALTGAAGTLLVAVVELVATHGGRGRTSIGLVGSADTGEIVLGLGLRADRLSALIAVAVALVAACVQLYSVAYLAADRRYPAYAAEVSLFTAAMLLVVQADDLVVLLIGWEVMGLCSYLLVGHDSQRPAARRAAVKAFLVTRVGDVGFVVGIVVLLAATKTSSISTLLTASARQGLPGWVFPIAGLLLVAGVAGKSAQFPLHTWLPDAMEGPTPVSALIHAATMVAAGAYVVARLLPVFAMSVSARDVLAGIACVSMLGAALAALGQVDLKRLLAYSTISQVAYMLAALAVTPGTSGGGAGIAHLLAHAGFKALLFLTAGAFAYIAGTTALAELAGGWRRAPLVATGFTLGLAALAGVPPLSGFWSKEAVLGAAEEAGRHGDVRFAGWTVLVVGLLTSVVTAAYATRAWLLVVPSRRVTEPDVAGTVADTVADIELEPAVRRVLDAMRWPIIVLIVPTVLGGLVQVGSLLPGALHLSWLTAIVVLALTVLAAAGVVRLAVRAPSGDPLELMPARLRVLLLEGFGIDRLQRRLVVRPIKAVARTVVAGDIDVIDAYARSTAVLSGWGGSALRRLQTGVTTSYLTWVAVGAVAVGIAGVSLR